MFRIKIQQEAAFSRSLAIFFAILGPGIITGSVDNDAGGITTYSVAGAMYGYGLIWTLIPSFIVLACYSGNECQDGDCYRKGTVRPDKGKCRHKDYLFHFYRLACFQISAIRQLNLQELPAVWKYSG